MFGFGLWCLRHLDVGTLESHALTTFAGRESIALDLLFPTGKASVVDLDAPRVSLGVNLILIHGVGLCRRCRF